METFENWLMNEGKNSSNKNKAILDLIDAIKDVFNKYDLATRKKTWQELTSSKGKELVERIIKNPKTYLSDSEFVKLIQKRNK